MKMEIEVNGLINHHMESFLIDKIITCIIEFGVDRKDIRIDGNAVRPDEDDDDGEV
ncbi:MAG: hypothetical protein OXU51_11550 [Candidatus Poribacteria bacterium]|nr:hypothetical protein [Candidatus Poribacteria bacterium]